MMRVYTVIFLQRLQSYYEPLPSKNLFYLNSLYRFSETRNAEIRTAFYVLVLREPKSEIAVKSLGSVLDWVVGTYTGYIQGRMKFCRPLFKAANKVDRDKTVAAYCGARTLFHPIARKLIEQVSMLHALSECLMSRGFAGFEVGHLLRGLVRE